MARSPLAICLMFIIVASSTLYEAQGHFLLKDYLKKFPETSSEFKPFAFKGMISFVDDLEGLCPPKGAYKEFFTELKAFMNFINSASGSSSEFNSQLKAQSEGLFKAISTLSGKAGSSEDTSKLIEILTSMGKTLAGYKRTGSQTITSEQRERWMKTMVTWAEGIGKFVKKVGEKSGDVIDLSSLGLGGGSSGSDSSSSEDGDAAGGPSGSPTDISSSGENSTENESAGGPSGSTSDMSTEGTSEGSTDNSAGGESSMNGEGSYSDTTGGSTMVSPVGSPSSSTSGSSESSYTGSGSSSNLAGGAPAGCH